MLMRSSHAGFGRSMCSIGESLRTYPQMVGDQTVKQVDIVLAEGAEVEEFVDGGLFEGQLGETWGVSMARS